MWPLRGRVHRTRLASVTADGNGRPELRCWRGQSYHRVVADYPALRDAIGASTGQVIRVEGSGKGRVPRGRASPTDRVESDRNSARQNGHGHRAGCIASSIQSTRSCRRHGCGRHDVDRSIRRGSEITDDVPKAATRGSAADAGWGTRVVPVPHPGDPADAVRSTLILRPVGTVTRAFPREASSPPGDRIRGGGPSSSTSHANFTEPWTPHLIDAAGIDRSRCRRRPYRPPKRDIGDLWIYAEP